MLIVDTSLWVDFLRRHTSEDVRLFIQQALREQTAAYNCVIAMELRAGCRNPGEEAVIRELLDLGRHIKVECVHWDVAADLLKHLHKSGHKVPLSDVLTAAVAIQNNLPIACRDKHFESIRKYGARDFEVKTLS